MACSLVQIKHGSCSFLRFYLCPVRCVNLGFVLFMQIHYFTLILHYLTLFHCILHFLTPFYTIFHSSFMAAVSFKVFIKIVSVEIGIFLPYKRVLCTTRTLYTLVQSTLYKYSIHVQRTISPLLPVPLPPPSLLATPCKPLRAPNPLHLRVKVRVLVN